MKTVFHRPARFLKPGRSKLNFQTNPLSLMTTQAYLFHPYKRQLAIFMKIFVLFVLFVEKIISPGKT
jgi:hypothetical protein